MTDITIKFEPPNFELDSLVYVVCGPNEVVKTTICSFRGLIFNDLRLGTMAIAKEARISKLILNDYFKEIEYEYVPFLYLTKTEEEATELAQWIPVSLTDNEWLLSIGDRDIKEDLPGNIEDGCELGQCCANISEIRDVFIKCKEKGGMIELERRELKDRLEHSCHDMPEEHEILDKILKQLNLEWK